MMGGSVTHIGRKLSRGCGGHETPAREAALAESGCHSSRLAEEGKAVLVLLGERHPWVSGDVVVSGDGGNNSRTAE